MDLAVNPFVDEDGIQSTNMKSMERRLKSKMTAPNGTINPVLMKDPAHRIMLSKQESVVLRNELMILGIVHDQRNVTKLDFCVN